MKKIIYSNYTKFLAVMLFTLCILLGALTATDGITYYFHEKVLVYAFESSFSESRHFNHMLQEPEQIVYNAYHRYYNSQFGVDDGSVENYIERGLEELYVKDNINYFVNINDKTFTNCGAMDYKEIAESQFNMIFSRNKSGDLIRSASVNSYYYSPLLEELIEHGGDADEITIATSVKEETVQKVREIWERQANVISGTIKITLVYAFIALLLLVYLICVCGRTKDGELTAVWVDNIWIEIHAAFLGVVLFGSVVISAIILDEYVQGRFPKDLLKIIVGTLSMLVSGTVVTIVLSVFRNIKLKRFLKSSIIVRVARWVFKTIFRVLRWLRNRFLGYRNLIFKTLSKKTGIILISMLFVYTALIGMFGVCTIITPIWLVLGVLLFGFATFVVAYRAKDLDEIKKGVSEVRNGNVAYKIPELKSEDMKLLANNVNDIAKGLDESVSAKLKAERLKTELITNVSHDLKTPLTSIISYTELLSEVEGLPEEAQDYVRIIANKSDRLKTLTQDLFDISKVQSGNEKVVLEKLDVSLLINQSLGEHDNEIQKSELPFCISAPKELYICADGRKMSRVISNLLNNILKYTMKNTRVFISAVEENGEVIMEFKNIASYPMNFSADEIVGRFVRGDESRTQDGNGLGLAIAKSYTEICNGKIDVIIDGDMFKVILKFKKYN